MNTGSVRIPDKVTDWSVYIILSANGSLYTGITNNMNRRWRQHRRTDGHKKGAKFFRGNKPLVLCYQEPNHTRQTASQREYSIKQLSHANKWQLILANYGPNK